MSINLETNFILTLNDSTQERIECPASTLMMKLGGK